MKWIVRIVLILAVLLLGFMVSSYWWLDGAARKAIEVAGAEATGVTVELKSINIGVFRGEALLHNLNVSNPPGYQKPYFFDLERGGAGVKLSTVTKETIEIPKIELIGITMYLEPDKGGKYNYERILANIEEFTKSDEPAPESETKVVVDELALRDIKVYYRLKNLNFIEAPVLVDEIILKDIGKEGAEVNMEELISIVISGALRGIAKSMPEVIGNGIMTGVGKLGDLGVMVGKATTAAVKDAAGKTTKEVEKGIKKILGGD